MKPTVEVLREARALYEANPAHTPVGRPVPEGKVCASLAIYHASTAWGDDGAFNGAMNALEGAMGVRRPRTSVPRWNASHTTAQVLEAFSRAIAAEEARAA